jgi:hypothetical protein
MIAFDSPQFAILVRSMLASSVVEVAVFLVVLLMRIEAWLHMRVENVG